MAEKLRQAVYSPSQASQTECLLLEDEACSVYTARPLSCHAFVSLDVNDCISTFRAGITRDIRMPQVHTTQRNLCRIILLAACQAAGLPTDAYLLGSAALSTVLALENAEQRWLAGEDILAALDIVPPVIPPEIAAEIDQLAASAAPAL